MEEILKHVSIDRFYPRILKVESSIEKCEMLGVDPSHIIPMNGAASLDENLELIDFPRELPPFDETVRICGELEADSLKLEADCLYDSIPVNQVRNMEQWACIKADEGKKTIIIENAERMQVSVRNALLKILEEPPADCVFILLTTQRNAIMQTILSRVRTYNFMERPLPVQKEVIQRVFHNDYFSGEISEYLLPYLPVPATKLRENAKAFVFL